MDDLISRQAAIDALTKDKKALERIINGMSGYEKEFERLLYQRNQVDYDIYAIEQLPPSQPERTPMQELLDVTADRDYWKAQCHSYEMTINRLTESAQSQPKRGKWLYQKGMIKCDKCLRAIRHIDHDGLLNFCPNCGADMREVTT